MSSTKPSLKTDHEDDGTTISTNPQWNNVESIFKPPKHDYDDDNVGGGQPIRKSPPRFLGKRNRNTSFDQQQQQGSIKKTLSWGPLPTDDLYNQDYPSNHRHQDGKASSSSAAPINPSRSPIIEDDDDDTDTTTHPTKYEDVTFPIKFSLSHDFNNKEDEDASLSEYLTEANFTMGPSPRGSPTMTFLPDRPPAAGDVQGP